jgi:hypothetical protein
VADHLEVIRGWVGRPAAANAARDGRHQFLLWFLERPWRRERQQLKAECAERARSRYVILKKKAAHGLQLCKFPERAHR